MDEGLGEIDVYILLNTINRKRCMYIYIYREREREEQKGRERYGEREREEEKPKQKTANAHTSAIDFRAEVIELKFG